LIDSHFKLVRVAIVTEIGTWQSGAPKKNPHPACGTPLPFSKQKGRGDRIHVLSKKGEGKGSHVLAKRARGKDIVEAFWD
jgi:hypothetical protein